MIAAACLTPFLTGPGLWLPAIFLVTAAYLMVQNIMPPVGDAGLRVRYRRQLQMRRQMRHFLSWLWAAPFLLAACRLLVWPGYESGRAILVALGSSAIVSICFLARAADSECAGLLHERMARLESSAQ